jgi:predicted DNA-binding transcriptional regulator AlpA
MPTRFLTVKELAELLNLRQSWIYDRTGGSGPEIIPHIKLGRQVRFDPESEEFKAWLKAHCVVSQPHSQPRSLTA